MRCNSLDEQTILLSMFGNRALYLYIYKHEATQKSISVNNIGAPLAPQQGSNPSYFIELSSGSDRSLG